MKVLVLGASGATGKLVVSQLLQRQVATLAVVRPGNNTLANFKDDSNFEQIHANVDDLAVSDLAKLIESCQVVISCLGHNLSFHGVYGKPRKLVSETVEKVALAAQQLCPTQPLKLLLMNSTGCKNPSANEKPPFSQRAVVGLLRWALPPHRDNELANHYLRTYIGDSSPYIEWAAIRPDGLVDEDTISDYQLFASPQRNAIFDAGTSSRINVADFFVRLATDDTLWQQWRFQMPVLYNQT